MTAQIAPSPVRGLRDFAVGNFVLRALGGFAAACGAVWSSLDSAGWISHDEQAAITARADWFVGEKKICASQPDSSGSTVSLFNCDDGPSHRVSVRVWGREKQSEFATVYWDCARNAEGFECRELSVTRR